jgi:hypothetical protein
VLDGLNAYTHWTSDLDLDLDSLPGVLAGLVAGAKDDYITTLGVRNYSKKYKNCTWFIVSSAERETESLTSPK